MSHRPFVLEFFPRSDASGKMEEGRFNREGVRDESNVMVLSLVAIRDN